MRIVLTKREGSIELLRIVLMFGICLLHSITQAGHCIRGFDNVLHSCVDGFVFVVCVAIDCLRRRVLTGLKKMVKWE